MALDEQFAATIQKVEASFGFSQFTCDPNLITAALGVEPDEAFREGTILTTASGRIRKTPFNSWSICSRSRSKDVNDHLRDLFSQLRGLESRMNPSWGLPSFNVLYKATHLISGNGPYFERDVIASIASFGAELWQDIYSIEEVSDMA